jgi:hypothetical protein
MTAAQARFCPRHHVAIGPRGCPRCEREESLRHREEEHAFWRWAAWASLPLVAVGLYVVLRSHPAGPDRLDPEPYRRAIETAESVLYRGDRLTADDRSALADGLLALSEALHRTTPSPAWRRAIEGMDRFLNVTAIEARDETFDVVRVRKDWEGVRQACLQDAEWFEHSSQALEEAQTSSSARGVPPDADRYDKALEDVRFLANRAQTYVEMLPEGWEEMDGDAYDRWQSQRKEMAADIARAREGFPLKRNDVDASWRKALGDLERALDAVSRMFAPDPHTPTLVPSRGSASIRIGTARSAIQRAQDSIAAAAR